MSVIIESECTIFTTVACSMILSDGYWQQRCL